jgi:hypothetical protein
MKTIADYLNVAAAETGEFGYIQLYIMDILSTKVYCKICPRKVYDRPIIPP